MNKADEEQLSGLHGKVAIVLTEQLNETIEITDDDTGKTETVYTATPATLAQAIKFLKDNDITASVADDDNLKGLKERLAENDARREAREHKLKAV